ncbi:hypothetical protein CCUS01_15774 [Colletotrichum cuscutae]|uniref:Class II aldolase/adducin N-terminal domain-containing protein n=1 Tax=Colletotrichum cuscutae TaxID=1209917 RepID=A0AAI9VHU4_9PEZI|nr:hypothetical protein CCUS01_15774 [Colletotrichum cuscutae]
MSSLGDQKKTPLDAIVQGSTMQAMPTFSDVSDKRAFMLDHMAHAFHVFARRGYSEGMAGHISVRDPEFPDKFWLNPARPDVVAACHCHTRFGKAWSAFGCPFEMLNGDAAMFYGDAQAVLTSYGGLVFEESLSDPVASALGLNGRGLIMQNHGLLTVGQSVDEAAYLFISDWKSNSTSAYGRGCAGANEGP